MKTIIEYKDGRVETVEGAVPNVYGGAVSLIDADDGVIRDDEPLEPIARIVFEND
jgi:hypothetical protein